MKCNHKWKSIGVTGSTSITLDDIIEEVFKCDNCGKAVLHDLELLPFSEYKKEVKE